MPKTVRTLIVDDSSLVRRRLREVLNDDPDIEVIGEAADAYEGRDLIVEKKPDVVTLDLQMPRMDGLTFLKKIMKHMPLPVIVVSALTREGARHTLEALEIGAVEVMAKPSFTDPKSTEAADFATALCDKVKACANTRPRPKHTLSQRDTTAALPSLAKTSNKIVAMGASTGGTEALTAVLTRMPANAPAILIVQHMPPGFTAAFAERLNSLCQIEVLEAADGMEVGPGRAIIAPGGEHMLYRISSGRKSVQIKTGPLVCRHRPSVEVLFNSVTKTTPRTAIGVLLTGMGRDGADALLKLRQAGAHTIAQDEASSVVFGMPKEAIKIDAAEKVISLDKIASAILSLS